jgi:hypothetical protein
MKERATEQIVLSLIEMAKISGGMGFGGLE